MTLYCNFCWKSEHEVRKLVAGPDRKEPCCICDECIWLAMAVVDGDLVWPELIGAEGAPDVSAIATEVRNAA